MTVNTQQLLFILDNTPATQNIMLVGKHGIGKSRILEDYYSKKGVKVVTLFLGQMADPADLIGLPEKNQNTGKTDFMLPYWFPLDNEPVVLFLDELNRARPEVLQTIMDLTLNRKLAGKTLPEGSRIISAVNNGSEYQLTDLDPALVSRFNIYVFDPTVQDWLMWAEQKGLDSRIINFISENPEFLDGTDLDNQTDNLERTPDRRSWERTSEVIKNFPELTNLHKPMVSGIIGNRATTVFFRFITEHNIPAASEVLLSEDYDFDEKFSKLSGTDLIQLNTSFFRFIESSVYAEEIKPTIARNLINYFKYLGKNNRAEIQSHFAGLCSAETYPETLVFITEECDSLYEELMGFIMDL
ncbi:MAG: AAA family ATPase [Treponema sp.]|nr:AAA family ATPase [Treponema sp.]